MYQAVMNLDQPREALRIGLFFGAQKFHLFFISLPGQKLVDHSLELSDNVYAPRCLKEGNAILNGRANNQC